MPVACWLCVGSGAAGVTASLSLAGCDALPPADTWLAVMDGDRYVNDYLTHRTLSRLAFLLPSAVVIAIITGYAFWAGGWRAAYGPCLSPLTSWLPGGGCLPCMGGALRACIPRPLFVRLVGGPGEFGGGCEERANKSPEDSAEAGAGMTRKALRITKEDASGVSGCLSSERRICYHVRAQIAGSSAQMPRHVVQNVSSHQPLGCLATCLCSLSHLTLPKTHRQAGIWWAARHVRQC
jgi:hypothetical protein